MIRHSAVESALGYYFAKPGRIDSKYHRMLINVRKIREIADYDIHEEIVEPDESLKLKECKAFIEMIKKSLESDQRHHRHRNQECQLSIAIITHYISF